MLVVCMHVDVISCVLPQWFQFLVHLGKFHPNYHVGVRDRSGDWILKMLLVMCCYEASMLPLATGIFVRMLNSGGQREVWRNSWVAPGIEVNSEGHTSAVVDQDHPQMIEICTELKRFSGLMHGVGHVTYTKLCMELFWKLSRICRL
jgi:hypothetical protein